MPPFGLHLYGRTRRRFFQCRESDVTSMVYRIDPATGALSVIGDMGVTGINGLLAVEQPLGLLGDVNGDRAIDMTDFIGLADCMAGPDVALPAGCECSDIDADWDVDLIDFYRFQQQFTGPLR